MIPSSLAGLVLFVVLLAPGLAYIIRYERTVPAVEQSAFRETLRVIFVSVACLTVTILLFTALRWWQPDRTPNVRGLIRDPGSFAREHHVQLIWWGFALLASATALGAGAAGPRAIKFRHWARSTMVGRLLLSDPPIRDVSAWRLGLTDLLREQEVKLAKASDTPKRGWRANRRERAAAKPKRVKLRAYAGAQMADGSYIEGYIVSYNSGTSESDQRELIIANAKMRPAKAKGKAQPIGHRLTILSARHIVRLDITYLKVRPEPSAGTARKPASGAVQQQPGTGPDGIGPDSGRIS